MTDTKYRPLHEQGMKRILDVLSGSYSLTQFVPLIGRRLVSVSVEEDKTVLVFHFEDGEVKYNAEGDCCSQSWIEHIELPNDIAGAEIVSVSESPVIDATEDDAVNPKRKPYYEGDEGREHECLQVYQTVFATTKGEIAVEYRNSSNGYYGGSLELVPLPCPRCGEEISRYGMYEHAKCFGDEEATRGK